MTESKNHQSPDPTQSAGQADTPISNEVNLATPYERRPLCGHDVEEFRQGLGITRAEMAAAMAQRGDGYARFASGLHPLNPSQEILLRLYMRNPAPAPWVGWTPKAVFLEFYRETLQNFPVGQAQDTACSALFLRFAAMLGRSPGRGARWIDEAEATSDLVTKILGKVGQEENPKQALEEVSRLTYSLRGLDVEKKYPIPTRESIQLIKRGRKPKKKAPELFSN